MSEECIFCKIIEGEGNARKLYEDATTLCILDIAQIVSDTGNFIPGRCLVIPKRHVAWFYDLEDEEAGHAASPGRTAPAARLVGVPPRRAAEDGPARGGIAAGTAG